MTSHIEEKFSAEIRLFKATQEILTKQSYSALTIRNICKVADCSTSTFYQYYHNKDDLLTAAVIQGSINTQKNSIKALELGLPLHSIIYISLFTTAYIETQDVEFVRNYLTPSNIAINPDEVIAFKRSGWLMDKYISKFRQAQKEGKFLPGSDINIIRCEQNIIYYGCIFEWAIRNGGKELVRPMRNMLIRNLNGFVIDEYKLPIEDKYWEEWLASFNDTNALPQPI